MQLLDLRERVERALADAGVQLGTYHTQALGDVPALYVGDPPEGTTVDGLEVMIYPQPHSTVVSTFGGSIQVKRWRVRLIRHDAAADLEGATDALVEAFEAPTPQFIDEAGDIAEQVLVTIPDDPE